MADKVNILIVDDLPEAKLRIEFDRAPIVGSGDRDLVEARPSADVQPHALLADRARSLPQLGGIMQRDPSVVPAAVDLIFVARNLERIGDHATNIAEDVVFLVKGIDVRHHAEQAENA